MARPVIHHLDPVVPCPTQGEEAFGEVAISELVARADVVGLSRYALAEHKVHGRAVVVYVAPVPDVLTVAVERDLPTAQQFRDEQRDNLFGELETSVVVVDRVTTTGSPWVTW